VLVPRALALEDTDWHLAEVYGFARELDASVLVPRFSRYVIDLNRPPENAPMYPGANNTELVPTRFFTGDALYREGCVPGRARDRAPARRVLAPVPRRARRRARAARRRPRPRGALGGAQHPGRVPWLFEGRLPDLNLGSAGGPSCAPSLRAALMAVLAAQSSFSHVTDGRFKGGYITRRTAARATASMPSSSRWRCRRT
jgi:N-formylglutamate deformylase